MFGWTAKVLKIDLDGKDTDGIRLGPEVCRFFFVEKERRLRVSVFRDRESFMPPSIVMRLKVCCFLFQTNCRHSPG